MVLKDTAFKRLEEFVDSNPGLEYVVVCFEMSKDKTEVIKYFAPIYANEPVTRKELSRIFFYFLGFVVYDRERFVKNKNEHKNENKTESESEIFSIVKKVLNRRYPNENGKLLISYLESLDYEDYNLFIQESDSSFIPLLSDAIHSINAINGIEKEFKKFDINFLNKKQREKIVKKSDSFNKEEFNTLSVKKQAQYIEDTFDAKKYESNVYHEAAITVRAVLKKLNLTEVMDDFFFEYIEDKQYLEFTKNFFTEANKKEIFTTLCEGFYIDIEKPLHKNAEIYYKEIIREIKFVNLYELEDKYILRYRRNYQTLKRLFEKMSKDQLSGFKFYTHSSYANNTLNGILHIESDIEDRIDLEIQEDGYSVFQEDIRDEIEDEYLDKEDYKSNEIINLLDSDEYKSLTKREKERLKKRKKKATQKRAKSTTFNYEERAKEDEKTDKFIQEFNIKVDPKATN